MNNMKIQFNLRHICTLLMLAGLGQSGMFGQAIGVEVVVDTAFYGPNTPTPEDAFDPEGILDGYVSYLVYVNFTNEDDVLSAVFSDIGFYPQGGSLGLNAPCGCWNPITNSMVMDATNNSLLWQFPATAMYEYDTFWTIGQLSGDAPGQTPTWISSPSIDGTNICSSQVGNGSAFVTGTPVNATAGEDLKIVVARVTTCGDWTLNLYLQVFVDGDTDQEQLYFLDADGQGAITVEDPCEDYDEAEANVTGTVPACAGLTTDVALEFLGLDTEETTYTLATSTDGFVSDTTVLSQTASTQFPGLEEGDYEVYVANEFGCYDTTAFSVEAPPAIEAAIELTDDNSCFGEADAVVVLPDSTLLGGTGGLVVTAVNPQGATINPVQANGLYTWDGLVCIDGEGDFIFTVSDANGCTLKDTVQVNCPEPIDVVIDYGDVVCQGDADGFIVAEASGGSGDLYLTNATETVLASDGLLDLGPSTYQVYVFDDFNCSSDTVIVEIEEPAALEISIGDITNPSCGLDCDGEVALSAIGGSGALDVSYFNTTTGGLSTDSIGLCAGDYVATVTDTSGCQLSALFEVEAPAPLDFLIAPTNATCTGMSNGSADIFPIGGTVSDQEYDWVVLDTAGNVANLNNLSEMTYTALVTDQIGCSYSETFDIGIDFVTDMELNTLTSPVTCWNAADGTATVSVNGGEAPFSFEWSDPFGQTTSTAVGLTEDTYTVVVTDALGCRRTASQFVDAIEGCLFIADALTPNDDNKNDDWVVGGLEDYPESKVMVFNRWGQKLFESEGGKERWDGRFNGARLPVADYYYTIELFPEALPIRGTVTLKY